MYTSHNNRRVEDGSPGMHIDLSFHGPDGRGAVLKPEDYIDTTTAPDVEQVILDLLSRGCYRIIVNLQDVDYVNSSGWGTFIREIRQIRKNSGDLVLAHMAPDVHAVYETMEFSKILRAFPGLEQALEYFETQR